MPGDLSVTQAAEALGTSPQTVRTLLRKGELQGRKREWGSRYIWEVSQASVDEFVDAFGRFDGQRRAVRPELPVVVPEEAPPTEESPPTKRWLFFLRPRGRASVVVIILGLPLLIAFVVARVLPGVLWFDEVGQLAVFRRIVTAKADFHGQVLITVALFVGVNLAVSLRGQRLLGRASGVISLVVGSIVVGNLFASAMDGHWQTYLLWRHRQPFGAVDPMSGKDVGFFVFSLPFYLQLCTLLLWLVVVTLALVVVATRASGRLQFRPLKMHFAVQVQVAVLSAFFLIVVFWRLRLERYLLALGQTSESETHAFAGAGYVDINVRSPALAGLSVLVLTMAIGCLCAPLVMRGRTARGVRHVGAVTGAALAIVVTLVVTLAPPLVQRYVVDPNPLLSEQPYLSRSIAATRAGLGLDQIALEPYEASGAFSATDFPAARKRLANVPTWDNYILEARMRELVTEPPYYQPQTPALDVVTQDGQPLVTAVSARELDLNQVADDGRSWTNDRVAYTHGLGLVRFSSTEIGPDREPRLLDSGLGDAGAALVEPRLYFGDLPAEDDDASTENGKLQVLTPTLDAGIAKSRWVLANTRRPEVDFPATQGAPAAPYHYLGKGGIQLSNWIRRSVFALALGSRELLLSDDITPDSRLLLHRDVHDRLRTLAPFIQWDSEAVPLTANGRVVYVVDGYTTSNYYPYAQQVALGGSRVSYARAPVVATVDGFTGDVGLFVTDDTEPLLSAWREIFPSLFRPISELPSELKGRLRYPHDLFAAQATTYERFHTTSPDQFVSNADAWARPVALSGPIDVAGGVDFDESDEDDLRRKLPPVYIYAPPPGETDPRLVLATYYTPTGGQNLVGTLSGWIDDDGRTRLGGLDLPRDPVTLGPAQVSRIVFATPRVSNLLGLRNLELRDLDDSSIDSVLLGRPRLVFVAGDRIQIQNLYEGSRGAGAARLLGVTAFVDGRAGLGPNVESAVRQALNEPPQVRVVQPRKPPVVGKPTELSFEVQNARREIITITTTDGRTRKTLPIANGPGALPWVPQATGTVQVRVTVVGLDGTRASDDMEFEVRGPPPRLRLIAPPEVGVAGQPLKVQFRVKNALDAIATISTRAGVVFARRYELSEGPAVVLWTPTDAGSAVLTIRVRGTQDQFTTKKLKLQIAPVEALTPPTLALTQVPTTLTLGVPATISFEADSCKSAEARIDGPGGEARLWRFSCPAAPGRFTWTPTVAGTFVLTVLANGKDTTSQTSIPLIVEEP